MVQQRGHRSRARLRLAFEIGGRRLDAVGEGFRPRRLRVDCRLFVVVDLDGRRPGRGKVGLAVEIGRGDDDGSANEELF